MATRTQTATARRKAEEVKAKSDANGQAEEEAPETEDTIVQVRDKDGAWTDYARTTRHEALAALSAGHLPGSEREELRALDWITKEEVKPKPAKAPTTTKPAPKAPRKPRSGPATSKAGSAEGFDPEDPKTRAEVVRLHTEGKLSMKAIAEKFGLPAVHKSWLAVSLVWREEADARGLDRPRYPERSKK